MVRSVAAHALVSLAFAWGVSACASHSSGSPAPAASGPAPVQESAPPTCHDVTNVADAADDVLVVQRSLPAADASGGDIADGTYVMQSSTEYYTDKAVAPKKDSAKLTMVVQGGKWFSVFDSMTNDADHARGTAAVTVSGASLEASATCGSFFVPTSASITTTFTSTDSGFTIYIANHKTTGDVSSITVTEFVRR